MSRDLLLTRRSHKHRSGPGFGQWVTLCWSQFHSNIRQVLLGDHHEAIGSQRIKVRIQPDAESRYDVVVPTGQGFLPGLHMHRL